MLNKDVLDNRIEYVNVSTVALILFLLYFHFNFSLFLEGQNQHFSCYVKDWWKILKEEMKEYTNKQTDEKSSARKVWIHFQ